ncbi:hypothetical protein VP01_5766g1, partial [Puccinia sorghi]
MKRMFPLILKTNHKLPQSSKKGKKTAKNPPTCSQSTLDLSSSHVIDLSQDLEEENAKVKHKPQRRDPVFDDFKDCFAESYCCKGDLIKIYLIKLIYLWFGSLIISHGIPTSVFGERRKSMYLEAVCQIFGLIKMALVKLEVYQMASHNVKKPLKIVPNFLPLLCRK